MRTFLKGPLSLVVIPLLTTTAMANTGTVQCLTEALSSAAHDAYPKNPAGRARYAQKMAKKYDPTDVIDGRYMEFHGNQSPRTDDHGVLAIYLPLPKEVTAESWNPQLSMKLAEKQGKSLDIDLGEFNQYPFPIHVVTPGYFKNVTPVLKPPIGGNIWIADADMATASVDDSVIRGKQAGLAMVEHLNRLKQSR